MKILSICDGISCLQVALNKAGMKYDEYFASEVDPYPMVITEKNYPGTMQIGDIYGVKSLKLPKVDLICGGTPCTDLSISKQNREGLLGDQSKLFFEYVRILNKLKKENPDIKFILENVASMSEESKGIITKLMGVEPIMIDAALVSPQSRKRLFWTNIPVSLPEDSGLVTKDIMDMDTERKYLDRPTVFKTKYGVRWDQSGKGYFSEQDRAYSVLGKFHTVSASRMITKMNVLFEDGRIGVLNYNEIERLQGLPDDYTNLERNVLEKRGAAIGNGFHVDVIAHILKGL